MQISVDVTTLRRDIMGVARGMESTRQTITDVGYGAVLASRRVLSDEEKSARLADKRARKAAGEIGARVARKVEGWDIANFLASQGHDPYEYPPEDVEFVGKSIEEEVAESIEEAYKTGKSQKPRVVLVLTAAARHLQEAAQTQIKEGKLGTNTVGYRGQKTRRARGDVNPRRKQSAVPITTKYGIPPPYGVYSGRFIEGIRGVHFSKRPPSIAR